jgi:tetratricopeptide (TPR) repeat protein
MTSQDQKIDQSQVNDSFVQQVQADRDVSIQQTVTIHEGQKIQLIYSDPLPDLSVFQGRQAELEQLRQWLQNRTMAIIGIRGEGGIGKSTLAAKAFELCSGFRGKCWIDVRTGTSITEMAERALQEFGLSFQQMQAIEKKDLPQRLLRQLQTGRFLLAIDNLESVLTATGEWQHGYSAFIDGLQDLGSESMLLLASREYPSDYPGWRRSGWLSVEHGLEPEQGSVLLAALEVEDTAENRAAVSAQVQGNPLALSLIAGWLRQTYRPGERILDHLQQSDLWQLEGRHRGEQPISIERVLQWSMERLSPALQHLLAQVSVLRGTFNTEAAGELVLEQFVSEADLDDLERRTLLQTLPERDKYGLRVFRLHPRIRDFVQKRATDLTVAHERAIAYFWSRRTIDFTREDAEVAISEYEETFYHECQLERYSDATATVFTCDIFLRRRGYYPILVALYSQLHTDWQPTSEQYQTYADVCNKLGSAYFSLGQYQHAIDFYQQSLEIQREIGNRSGEAASLGNLGNVYFSWGQYQRAIDFYQQSLEIQREIGNRSGEATSLNNLGNVYFSWGQYQRAIDFYQQSLEIDRETDDRSGEATSLNNLGNVYFSWGQYQRAIDFYQQSLEIQHEIGHRNGEATSLGNLSSAYFSLGQYQHAISFCQQSLEIQREIGHRSGEATSLGNLSSAYFSWGQYQRAIDFYQQSLEIQHEIGDRSGEATSLSRLGSAYFSLGQYQRAIDFHQQSLRIQREIGHRSGEATSLDNLGNLYHSLGQYQRAIGFCQQSLRIQREIGDRSGEATSLGNLGNVYRSLGQYQRAIDFHRQSLEIQHEIGHCSGEATSLDNLGSAYFSLGQYQRAIDFYQQSLEIQREIGNRHGEATSLNNLGNAYCSLEQYQSAINFHQQSLEIQHEIGDRQGIGASLFNLGNALVHLDDHFNALQSYRQALVIYEALKLDHIIERCKATIAQCNQVIVAERCKAASIDDEKPKKDDWGKKSKPTTVERTTSRSKFQSSTQSQPWVLWFTVGLAIALLVWLLQR